LATVEYEVLVDGAPAGDVYRTGFAASDAELAELWAGIGLTEPLPEIDFERRVVVYFGPAESSSCPFEPISDLRFDATTRRLYPGVATSGGPACTADANPHAIVVAVDRAELPEPNFEIWVDAGDPPACCTDGITVVTAADLAEAPTASVPATTVPPATGDSAEIIESSVEIPSGSFRASPDDVFILHDDGDLWLHRGVLGSAPAEPVRVADLADPRGPVNEGPGPNVVEAVAGVVDGSVLYSDCCEPVAGNLLAATAPDATPVRWSFGTRPTLDASGTRLVATAYDGITVVDLVSGTARTRPLGTSEGFVLVVDVTWGDDGSVVALVMDDQQYVLVAFDAALDETARRPIGTAVDPAASGSSFASADAGRVVVAELTAGETILREYDSGTLAEIPAKERRLPPGATAVEMANDGSGLLWVVGDELWYEPAGAGAVSLGTGFVAAWFAA
jgi:hypothetical protein